ncbi:MAG: hypothetical protein R2715_05240 [Ilumatobacteraceae bacterium]
MRTSAASIGLAWIFGLAACGGSTGDDSSSPDPTVGSGAIEAGPGQAPTSVTFSGAGSGDFCAMARELDQNDPTAGMFESDDPATLEADWASYEQLIGEVVAAAPGEIKSDFQSMSDALSRVGEVYAEVDWDPAAFNERISSDPELATSMNDPALQESSLRIDAYLQDVCGIGGQLSE